MTRRYHIDKQRQSCVPLNASPAILPAIRHHQHLGVERHQDPVAERCRAAHGVAAVAAALDVRMVAARERDIGHRLQADVLTALSDEQLLASSPRSSMRFL